VCCAANVVPGKGKFSTVYRAKVKESGQSVALKKIQVLTRGCCAILRVLLHSLGEFPCAAGPLCDQRSANGMCADI
jgi:hypothetical protein